MKHKLMSTVISEKAKDVGITIGGTFVICVGLIVGVFGSMLFCAYCDHKYGRTFHCHDKCNRINFIRSAYRKPRFVIIFSFRLFTFLIKDVIMPFIVGLFYKAKNLIGG